MRGTKPDHGLPQPVAGEVRKPPFVKDAAARLWRKYAPDLIARKWLTILDADMFGIWCNLMAEYQESPREFTSAKLLQMRLYGESFGLTPPGRARMKLKPSNSDDDPAEKYFGGPQLVKNA